MTPSACAPKPGGTSRISDSTRFSRLWTAESNTLIAKLEVHFAECQFKFQVVPLAEMPNAPKISRNTEAIFNVIFNSVSILFPERNRVVVIPLGTSGV
jgi:hypothetical protein